MAEHKWYTGWQEPMRASDPWVIMEYDTLEAAVRGFLHLVERTGALERDPEAVRMTQSWLANMRDDLEWMDQRCEAMGGTSFLVANRICWLAKLRA